MDVLTYEDDWPTLRDLTDDTRHRSHVPMLERLRVALDELLLRRGQRHREQMREIRDDVRRVRS